ncbi:hypothetical protein EV122DRAFT_216076 [Schizophyllum commune]
MTLSAVVQAVRSSAVTFAGQCQCHRNEHYSLLADQLIPTGMRWGSFQSADVWHHINNLWDSVLAALRSAKEPNETQLASAWELTTLASSEFYFGDLERRRAQLLQRRTLLQELVDIQHAVIAPIRILPVELLSEIFVFATLSDRDCQRWAGAEHVLSSVCIHWRDVALATPALWACINVRATSRPPPRWREGVRIRLKRSSGSPLNIAYDCVRSAPQNGVCQADFAYWDEGIWKLLCSHAHRWQKVLLGGLPIEAYKDRPRLSFPVLDELVFYPFGTVVMDFFADAPNLGSLSRAGWRPNSGPIPFPSAWKLSALSLYIKPLTGVPFYPKECIEALGSCSASLRMCLLHILHEGELPVGPETPTVTVFPRLERLRLIEKAVAVASYMAAPKLTHLTVEHPDVSQDSTFTAMAAFLAQSDNAATLKSVALLAVDVKSPALINGLAKAPFVDHLDLLAHSAMKMRPEAKVTDDLVQALTRTGSAESMAFLPRLKKLTMRFLNYDNFPTERLRDAMGRMLDSRMNTALAEGSDPKLETLEEVRTDCECKYLVGLSFGSSCLSSSATSHSRSSFSSDWGPEVAWNGYVRDPAADGNSDSAHSSPLAHTIAELVQQDYAPHPPISHLPIELLSEIFEFACLSEHNDHDHWLDGELALAAVSHNWRAVAIWTSRIWTHITVRAQSNPSPDWREGVRVRLERSSNMLLTITWTLHWHPHARDTEVNLGCWDAEIFALLCAQAHRWHGAELGFLPLLDSYGALPRPSFPHLHELIVYPFLPLAVEFFGDAPNLTTLPWVGYCWNDPITLVPGWRIASLHLSIQPPMSTEFEMLTCMRALQSLAATIIHCHLTISHWVSVQDSPWPAVTVFDQLRHLRLSEQAFLVGGYISAPGLVDLIVERPRPQDDVLTHVATFIDHSNGLPALQTFVIRYASIWHQALLDELSISPHITELDLIVYGGTAHAMATVLTKMMVWLLTRNGDATSAAFLPRLRRLGMFFLQPEELPNERLREEMRAMVRSRRQGGIFNGQHLAALESFETDCGGDWP